MGRRNGTGEDAIRSDRRRASPWGLAILWLLVAAGCSPTGERPRPPAHPSPSPSPAPRLDKWRLWTGEAPLRGANIWQRFVVPELDGGDFLGGGPIGPPYIQEDFDLLAATGANLVVLSHPGLFTETPPYVLSAEAQANLDALLQMAARADLFAVISFRTGPGRSDFTFYRDGAGEWFDPRLLIESVWSDPEAQQAWAEMWRYTAERYRDDPIVAGFELLCEPNADDVVLGLSGPEDFYPRFAGTIYDWNRWYPALVAAIREVDPWTPILVPPMGWGSVEWLPYLALSDDPRIVYTLHQYSPNVYTHQEAGEPLAYPGELDRDGAGEPEPIDRGWLHELLGLARDFVERHSVPVAFTEFGVTRWAPGADEFIADQAAAFDALGASHALWVWDSSWKPCTDEVNGFGLRFGPDPANAADVPNDLLETVRRLWSRNTVRPSSFVGPGGPPLEGVRTWLYLLDTDLEEAVLDEIEASEYDLVVLDYIPSQEGSADYPMAQAVERLHRATHPKIVLAYLDIGEAESFRSYWRPGWEIGDPAWILGHDPEGWAGDFPVAYWDEGWRSIWLGSSGLVTQVVSAGFDGMYLDWVEAYDDETVAAAADGDGVDARSEMIRFVSDLAAAGRAARPGFRVVAQNAASLLSDPAYARILDGIAQEQIWFDGGPDDDPPGDCPLPRRSADVESEAYLASLSAACRRTYRELPDGTLHTSTEEYLALLLPPYSNGLPVLTVDYAVQPGNVAWVYRESRRLGWIPFVTNRGLDTFRPAVP